MTLNTIGSTRKNNLKHKIESINGIMTDDPQFKYYCRLLNIEPSYIKNKLENPRYTSYTPEQQPMIIEDYLCHVRKNKTYQRRR